MSSGTPSKVFVSYTRPDRAWAEWIAWILEAAGYRCTLDVWDFGAGTNWALKMDQAARECDRTLLVLTDAYLQAPYPAAEWAAAFRDDPTGEARKLVPVRVVPCQLTGLLGSLVPIDLAGLEE